MGKELEKALSPGALLISMDLFVRIPRYEWDSRIEEGNIRLRDWYDLGKAREILRGVKAGKGLICEDLYDVETGTMRGCLKIDPGMYKYFILEGLFSLDDELDGLVDLGIFVDTPSDVALSRAETRDESKRHLDPHWWIEKKEIYYDGYLPYIDKHRKQADIVIGGS
jgi:uridine kinase